MTAHERCMIATACLEIDLFGAVVSESVEEYIHDSEAAKRFATALTFGGSRALNREKAT